MRTKLSPYAERFLFDEFRKNAFPGRDEIARVAEELQMSVRQVKVWFQNHRQRGLCDTPSGAIPSLALLLGGVHLMKHGQLDVDAVVQRVFSMSAPEVEQMSYEALRNLDALDLEWLSSLTR